MDYESHQSGKRSTRWRVDTRTKCIILRKIMMTSCIPCVHRYCQHIPLASGLGRTLDRTQTLERSEAQIPQPLLSRFSVLPAQHHVTHLILPLPCLCYLSRITMHNMQLFNGISRFLCCFLTNRTTYSTTPDVSIRRHAAINFSTTLHVSCPSRYC